MSSTAVRSALARVYAAFFDGYGGPSPSDAWGIDLGVPIRYTKDGTVFRQEFECGLTLANIGDADVLVLLGRTYRDFDGVVRTSVTVPARGAAVLLPETARPYVIPRQTG